MGIPIFRHTEKNVWFVFRDHLPSEGLSILTKVQLRMQLRVQWSTPGSEVFLSRAPQRATPGPEHRMSDMICQNMCQMKCEIES